MDLHHNKHHKYPGNMIPVQAMDNPDPGYYSCTDNTSLNVYCRAKDGVIQEYLKQTPFEFVSNDFLVYISDMRKASFELGGFYDMGLVIPVKYKDIYGGHVLFEFESEDWGIACGRELWGYPKKFAEACIEEKDGKVVASTFKRGVEIIHLEVDFNKPTQSKLPDFKLNPHLQLHTIPEPDGHGIYMQRLLMRDPSPNYVSKRCDYGFGVAEFKSLLHTPLADFTPEEVYGASFTVGDSASTEEHGPATCLEMIVKPKF